MCVWSTAPAVKTVQGVAKTRQTQAEACHAKVFMSVPDTDVSLVSDRHVVPSVEVFTCMPPFESFLRQLWHPGWML